MKKIVFAIIVFLVIGGYMIVTDSDLDLEEEDDRKTFMKSFKNWVFSLGKNLKSISSYTVKEFDWLPTNETSDNNES